MAEATQAQRLDELVYALDQWRKCPREDEGTMFGGRREAEFWQDRTRELLGRLFGAEAKLHPTERSAGG